MSIFWFLPSSMTVNRISLGCRLLVGTNEDNWGCHFRLWETVINSFQHFLILYRPNNLSMNWENIRKIKKQSNLFFVVGIRFALSIKTPAKYVGPSVVIWIKQYHSKAEAWDFKWSMYVYFYPLALQRRIFFLALNNIRRCPHFVLHLACFCTHI